MSARLAFGLLLCSAMALAAPPLTPVPMVTGEWPPYVSAALPNQGSFVDSLRTALAKVGLVPQLTFASWPIAEHMIDTGSAFAAFPYAYTAERAARFDFSLPVTETRSILFYRIDTGHRLRNYRTPTDLVGIRVATPRGYWYEPILRGNAVTFVYASDEAASFRLLLAGRADAVIQDELVGWYLIDRDFPDRKASIATSVQAFGEHRQPLRLMVSRRYPNTADLLKRINTALAGLPVNTGQITDSTTTK